MIELPWPERAGMERRLLDVMCENEDERSVASEPTEVFVLQDDPCASGAGSTMQPYIWDSATMTFASPDAAERVPKNVR